jgi:hypothetical protein
VRTSHLFPGTPAPAAHKAATRLRDLVVIDHRRRTPSARHDPSRPIRLSEAMSAPASVPSGLPGRCPESVRQIFPIVATTSISSQGRPFPAGSRSLFDNAMDERTRRLLGPPVTGVSDAFTEETPSDFSTVVRPMQ